MTPERWAKVERLYHAALAREVGERGAFLRETCEGDVALRREVELLLAQQASAEGFLEEPALAIASEMVGQPAGAKLVGRQLGVYRLQALLGAGGMAEVYLARDTTLGRDVAIKILPQEFTADPDRLARFAREARVLAAMNHPNIATIHGVEQSGGVRGIVMELVAGETLAERIQRGTLPMPEALKTARQISEALDVAHEKGIVHRDLKPANIKVTAAGVVKVLDFGLAKVSLGTSDTSQLPTVTRDGTHEGTILGTAAYMSPEQARGQAVDKRTDIWAFGCVLYEMLTRQVAFSGQTIADTIAAVLEREPDWSALPTSTPPPIRRLLERCLEKDHSRRLRDIGDARLELEDLLTAERSARPRNVGDHEHAIDHALSKVEESARAAAPPTRAATRGRVVLVLAGLVAGAIGALTWRSQSKAPQSGPILGAVTQLTADAGLTTEPTISPDGRLVAYASDRADGDSLDIWVQQTTGGSAIRLTSDPANDREPDVSPDGSLVAFRSDRHPPGIYVAPALGGDARLIAPDGRGPRFSPDGGSIAFWKGPWLALRDKLRVRQMFVITASGGELVQLAATLANAGDPVWSPDQTALLVFGRQATSGDATDPDWWWVPLDGRPPTRSGVYARLNASGLVGVDDFPYPSAWTSAGVLFADGTPSRSIWSISVDPRTGRVSGDPIRLTTGTTADVWPRVSRDGRMVFAATTEYRAIFGLSMEANSGRVTGGLEHLRDDLAETGRPGASEDGRLLVFPRYEFGAGGLWIRDLGTKRERQLVATPPELLNPIISPDGQRVAYTLSGVGYVVEVGGGAPRRVCGDCQVVNFARDNRQILILERDAQAQGMVTRVDPATGARAQVLAASTSMREGSYAMGSVDRPMIAPNERWMAFTSSGNTFVAPLRAGRAVPESEWITVHEGVGAERIAGLSPDGRLLYLLLERDGFRCLYGLRLDSLVGRPVGEPFLVHHFHDASRQWGSTGFGSAVVTGMFFADLRERKGNILMTTLATK